MVDPLWLMKRVVCHTVMGCRDAINAKSPSLEISLHGNDHLIKAFS